VEGWAKRSPAAEFKRHLAIAHGESAEARFWLDLAADEEIDGERAKSAPEIRAFEAGNDDSQSLEGMAEVVVRHLSFTSFAPSTSSTSII
jgi:hypothetical protein